jgi:hypothetical protein
MSIRSWLPLPFLLAAFYGIAWTAAYLFFVGGDFQFYFEYLRLAWTGPGEIPAFIQASALAGTVVLCLIYLSWRMLARKKEV